MIKVAILLATGFEEIEAITPIDILRRAGIEVIIVGLESLQVTGSHGITVNCDITIDALTTDLSGIITPGGMPGALNLSESEKALFFINNYFTSNKLVASICASPGVVLGKTDILDSKNFTCYPGFENMVNNASFLEDRVVIDGNVITSRGPGSAMEFSLAIVSYFKDQNVVETISKALLLPKIS